MDLSSLGLCPVCHGRRPVRRIMAKTRGRNTPQREAHLLELARRFKLRLPLFPTTAESRT